MIPSSNDPLPSGSVPPALPPPLNSKSGSARSLFAIFLSLCLALFLVSGVVSLIDDSLVLLFQLHLLAAINGILFLFSFLMTALVYVLMGLTPLVPKRLFLPVTLFYAAALAVGFPVLIYWYNGVLEMDWVTSCAQVIVGLVILYRAQGGFKLHWLLVPVHELGARRFSWRNLSGFLLVNVFVLLPAVMVYVFLCATLAVNHFSDGFMVLRPSGFSVQVRKYARDDGKTIELFPMAHVADARFYRKISQTFPTNSVILMEGVTDQKHLLTNEVNYARMAHALHLSEQEKEFEPTHGEMVMADVDVDQFSTNTIDFLNLVMLLHSRGLNATTAQAMLEYSPPPDFLDQLMRDLLQNRNRHLLEQIQTWLPRSDHLIVPWGVGHIPQISREIQKSGFRLVASREYTLIRFHFMGQGNQGAGPDGATEKTN